jgi:hypothetical protein
MNQCAPREPLRKETLLRLIESKQEIIVYNGGVYIRVCNSDYHPFNKIPSLWINNKQLLLSPKGHGAPLNGVKPLSFNGTVWWWMR